MKEFHGIIPPVLTPLNEKREFDAAGFEKLLERMIAAGIHGVFVLGTTGEGPMLPGRIQRRVVEEAVRIVNGRVPVLAGVSDASFENSAEMAGYAKASGADGIVAAPPCYMPLSDGETVDFFRELSARAAMPLFIYNMPSMTKKYLSPDLVCELAAIPGIRGYKDSSGNMVDFRSVLFRLGGRSDFSIFIGPEELLGDAVSSGADGGVAGGANLDPRLFVDLYDAAVRGECARVLELTEKVYLQRRLYSLVSTPDSMIRGVKCAMRQLGICDEYPAAPGKKLSEKESARAAEILEQLGLRE